MKTRKNIPPPTPGVLRKLTGCPNVNHKKQQPVRQDNATNMLLYLFAEERYSALSLVQISPFCTNVRVFFAHIEQHHKRLNSNDLQRIPRVVCFPESTPKRVGESPMLKAVCRRSGARFARNAAKRSWRNGPSQATVSVENCLHKWFCVRARLYSLLKNSILATVLKAHGFIRAAKPGTDRSDT